MISSDFRTEARRKLLGKWGKCACIMLAFVLISFFINFIESFLPDSIKWIGQIIDIIIDIPMAFGLTFAFLKLFKDEEVKAFDFLKLGFSNFGRSWGVAFQTFLKMVLPAISVIFSYILVLFSISMGIMVVPYASSSVSCISIVILVIGSILLISSIIWAVTKSYYYQLAYLISIENEDMIPADAVSESEKLMSGKRASLFCLQLSFIGWAILTAITFGIGILWLVPYVQFATIAFYKYAAGKNENVEDDLDK